MEADRVHSYLKIACSALGFEVGEVWITANETVSLDVGACVFFKHSESNRKHELNYCNIDYSNTSGSSIAHSATNSSAFKRKRRIQFLQLYISKHISSLFGHHHINNRNIFKDGIDHVLSPLLVNAVADTAQIIWAHCHDNKDGLSGRPDMLFQTAVGVPVANDVEGNMFIVVMFSPNNISSSKEAIEYLKYIGTFATSTTIPCLIPVVKDQSNTFQLTYAEYQKSLSSTPNRLLTHSGSSGPHLTKLDIGSGVSAQLFSFHDLTFGQDDTFSNKQLIEASPKDDPLQILADNLDSDVFDDASYGLWHTIMDSPSDTVTSQSPETRGSSALVKASSLSSSSISLSNPAIVKSYVLEAQNLSSIRKERLEEFASAFLGLSVFDAADVWVPVNRGNGGVVEGLTHSFTVLVTQTNERLNRFQSSSVGCLVPPWSGAVGRAFWSGNPVWSSNRDTIVEAQRSDAFKTANISTTLSVPIFSDGAIMPSCVICFYSLLQVDAVPFVLHFIQKALRLLWVGLDKIEPHESISRDLWENIAPADLGEMAADTEMQSAFLSRKRRRVVQDNGHILCLEDEKNGISTRQASLPISSISDTDKISRTQSPDAVTERDGDSAAAADAFLKLLNDMMLSCTAPGKDGSDSLKQIDISKSSMHTVDHIFLPPTNVESTPSLSIFDDKQSRTLNPESSSSKDFDNILNIDTETLGISRPASIISKLASRTSSAVYDPSEQIPHTVSNVQLSTHSRNSSNSDISAVVTQPLSSIILSDANDLSPNSTTEQPKTDLIVNNDMSWQIKEDEDLFLPSIYPTELVPYCIPTSSDISPFSESLTDSQQKGVFNSKVCEWPGCSKFSQGPTKFCIGHGGGHRCQYPGCLKGARDKKWCTSHGGGRRCKIEGCTKAAVGATSLCTNHGGGRRCKIEGCFKAAQSPTLFCVKHGGGRKCEIEGCDKVARGRTAYCASHGGGIRCTVDGCTRIAIGQHHLCRAHGGKSQRM